MILTDLKVLVNKEYPCGQIKLKNSFKFNHPSLADVELGVQLVYFSVRALG